MSLSERVFVGVFVSVLGAACVVLGAFVSDLTTRRTRDAATAQHQATMDQIRALEGKLAHETARLDEFEPKINLAYERELARQIATLRAAVKVTLERARPTPVFQRGLQFGR